jgi:hypothetical protein
VVEKDYANLHLNMVYALEGCKPPNGDLYSLSGINGVPAYRSNRKEWRKLVKFATNAMLNLNNTPAGEGLWRVIYDEIHGKLLRSKDPKTGKRKRSKPGKLKLPSGFKLTKKNVAALRDAIKAKHPSVAHWFMCGKEQGAKLQYLDSQMALRLIKDFQSIGILCLSEHDSFIVPATHGRDLVQKMQEAFCVIMNTSYQIPVK